MARPTASGRRPPRAALYPAAPTVSAQRLHPRRVSGPVEQGAVLGHELARVRGQVELREELRFRPLEAAAGREQSRPDERTPGARGQHLRRTPRRRVASRPVSQSQAECQVAHRDLWSQAVCRTAWRRSLLLDWSGYGAARETFRPWMRGSSSRSRRSRPSPRRHLLVAAGPLSGHPGPDPARRVRGAHPPPARRAGCASSRAREAGPIVPAGQQRAGGRGPEARAVPAGRAGAGGLRDLGQLSDPRRGARSCPSRTVSRAGAPGRAGQKPAWAAEGRASSPTSRCSSGDLHRRARTRQHADVPADPHPAPLAVDARQAAVMVEPGPRRTWPRSWAASGSRRSRPWAPGSRDRALCGRATSW